MEPNRKRQRGAVDLSNGDGYYADEYRQEGITEHGDRHGDSGRCFSHSPLFLSRQTSEEYCTPTVDKPHP